MIDGILGPVDQQYLLEARQMQALSLAVHIPLVCFGIAFPSMVLFLEGHVASHRRPALPGARQALVSRDGDPLRDRRRHRHDPVVRARPAVAGVHGHVRGRLRARLRLRGFSFFVEAIFIAIYVYGWDRLPRRVHFMCGIPIVIAGLTGSFFVISVNGWMNDPTGFRIENGDVVDVKPWEALLNDNMWHEIVHMYLAGHHRGGLPRGRGLRGRLAARAIASAVHRVALIVALSFASAHRSGPAVRR